LITEITTQSFWYAELQLIHNDESL